MIKRSIVATSSTPRLRTRLRNTAASAVAAMGLAVLPLLAAPTAAHAKPPVADLFGQRPNIFDAAISPDGRQIAMVRNYQGGYVVSVIDLDDRARAPRAVGLGKGVSPKYVRWVNDERVVVSLRQTQKFRGQPIASSFLYSVDTETMEGKNLVRVKKGFRQFNDRVIDWLEDDPDHILMEFADDGEPQSFPDVYRVNVATGRKTRIKKSVNLINGWVTDADGTPRVGYGERKSGEEAWMLIRDPDSDNWERHTKYPGLDPETMSVRAVTDSGRSLVVAAYRGKDTRGLHRYDLSSRSFVETLYENPKYDVGSVLLSKDGDSIVGASFTGESEERVLFDKYDSTFEEALSKLDGFQVDFVDQDADSDTLILRVSAPSDPGQMILYNRGGSATRIGLNMPGLSGPDMGEVLSVGYAARDGQRIPAFVTVPPSMPAGSPSNLPFIVLPHGGPFARDDKRFDYLAQFFATRGYGVLQMNFRGSEGYGKAFSDAGRDRWVTMQEDVEDGTRWLFEKGYADPNKTCIAGWSYGGYAALMGASKDPELYNCVVAIAALTDIPGAIDDLESYINGKAMAERTFGDFMDNKDLMRANNPVDLAHTIKAPVFMAHGTLDVAVEYDQFKKMKKQLERAGVDGTYRTYEDEDHYMSLEANRQDMLNGIEKFLVRHNGVSPYAAP